MPDLYGLKALQKEPVGAASLATLKGSVPPDDSMLDQLLGDFMCWRDPSKIAMNWPNFCAARPHDSGRRTNCSGMTDPEFMVAPRPQFLIDPKNWEKKAAQEGSTEGWEYMPPATEGQHLQRLQDASRQRRPDDAMWMSIAVALNNRRDHRRSLQL